MVDLQKVANLGFGGAALTNIKSYSAVKELLGMAYENGIRHYDTAPLYGKGYSEVIYGKFLKDKRNEITISTKFGLGENYRTGFIPIPLLLRLNHYAKKLKDISLKSIRQDKLPAYDPGLRRIDKTLIEKSFAKSVERLKTDYVDYYLLHEGVPGFLTDEALAFVCSLKQKGAVRFLGIGSTISSIKPLRLNELDQWDVLQYEGGLNSAAIEVMKKFPGKIHFHHSCLKCLGEINFEEIEPTVRAGFIFAQCVSSNPSGKIIFSTQKIEHLKNNLVEFLKYQSG